MNNISKLYKHIFIIINCFIGLFAINFHYGMLDVFGNNNEIYLEGFDYKDIIYFIIIYLLWLLIFYIIDLYLKNKKDNNKMKLKNNKYLFIKCLIILLLLWSPYYLSFFPGGVYSDTYFQFVQAKNTIIGNGYPVFYTLFLRLLYFLSFNNSTVMFGLITIFQIILFVVVFSYFIVWLNNKQVSKKTIIICLLFYGLYPRIPIYALSIWKDSLFSIFLFLYVLNLCDIILSKGSILTSKKTIIKYIIISVLVCLFRNNGYYLIIFISVIIMIKYRNNFSSLTTFYISAISLIVFLIGIYNVIFVLCGYKSPYKESIGINIQQIAYVVSNEENINPSSKIIINNIIPISDIKNNYYPMIVDNIKNNPYFDNEYLESHKLLFWRHYFKLMIEYPKDYFIAYLYGTVGFWNYYLTCADAGSDSLVDFYEYTVAKYPEEGDISYNTDILKELFHFSIKDDIKKMASFLNNCAIGSLIMFIGLYILLCKNKMDRFIIYLPSILILIVLLLETPIAFSSRYIIYTIFFIPLSLIIPFIEKPKNTK